MRGEFKARKAIRMWRALYHDHHLLGAQKDTMPRRKWLKLVGSALAASTFLRPSSAQQPSGKQFDAVLVDEVGAPESWEGSHPLSPLLFSQPRHRQPLHPNPSPRLLRKGLKCFPVPFP